MAPHSALQGLLYWQGEQRIAALMSSHEVTAVAQEPLPFALDDVLATSRRKSFDYRVLHCLLCSLHGVTQDVGLMKFLEVDEWLLDIGDDLVDYEDDILR